ncbi:hypothetical protein MKX01_017452 [Papaver californicum]|nr:hypothetical protein MKX01_017452 [Papaver californicum]
MNTLLNPNPNLSSPKFSNRTKNPRLITNSGQQISLVTPTNKTHTSIRFKRGDSIVRCVLDSSIIDQLGPSESGIINPSISTSYRSLDIPKPNQTLLDAQARVCTGPTKTQPLTEEQSMKVLDTILRSGSTSLNGLGKLMMCISLDTSGELAIPSLQVKKVQRRQLS